MARRSSYLERQGFNFRERLNVYTGMVVGALTPIVIAKTVFDSCVQERTPLAEAASWGVAVLFNAVPFVGGVPVAIYGAIIGGLGGVWSAQKLNRRRERKEREKESQLAEISAA